MLEGTTNRDRIISAALRLAETRGWRYLSLGEIAGEAGVPLGEFRKEFQSKGQILAAFSRAADMAVIEKFPAPGPDVARDRLFDVLLTRFEVMQPYKAAIRRIREDVGSSLREVARANAARAEIAILDAGCGRHQRGGRDRLPARAGAFVDLRARILHLAGRGRPRDGANDGGFRPPVAAWRVCDARHRAFSRRSGKLGPQLPGDAQDIERRATGAPRGARRSSSCSRAASDVTLTARAI